MLTLLVWFLATPPSAAAADVEIVPDVVYGHKDGLALTFDVIKPKGNANGAAVIFIVSGGWISAYTPPNQMADRLAYLLDRGFTVIPVRHGSSPKYLLPDILADVRRAVRFIRHRARVWGVDPNRMGVTGGSAGGHLSLMLGTTSDNGDPVATEPFLKESNRVASVVALYPPVDMPKWRQELSEGPRPPRERFPILNFEDGQGSLFSPSAHASGDDPPTLLIHGDKDEIVDLNQSKTMYSVLKAAGVRTELATILGAGHGFRDAHLEQSNSLTLAWFEDTLLGQPSDVR